MSGLMEENNKVLSFTLFKVEKGREKICRCDPPHYEIDTANRIVACRDCGATLDAFEALLALCRYMDQWRKYQEEALKKARIYGEWADREWNRRMKNKAFKDMDRQYHDGMLPHCPECGKLFDPAGIVSWSNEKFAEGSCHETDT